jgi:diaminopimelate decarboxylase
MTDSDPLYFESEMQDALRLAANRVGTPSYVYFYDRIRSRVEELHSAFGGRFQISYAVKANPNAALLRLLKSEIELLDVSSGGELKLALDSGYNAEQLRFSGPGKSVPELRLAVSSGCSKMIVESTSELEDLDAICAEDGRSITVLIRVNPQKVPRGFGVNMSGRPSQFGVDEEELADLFRGASKLKHVSIAGLHIYAGTQCLDPEAIVENFSNYIEIFRTYAPMCPGGLSDVIFGSGIGIPYHDRDEPVNLYDIAKQVNPMLDEMRRDHHLQNVNCILEIGRLLVGEAGYFLTRVLRKKQSRGKSIRILDGGMNCHLAACGHFGTMIPRNYRMFRLPISNSPGHSTEQMKRYELFGPLCTTIDQLGRAVELPPLDVGDVIAIACSGAYGASASPVNFISHGPPREAVVEYGAGELLIHDVTGV